MSDRRPASSATAPGEGLARLLDIVVAGPGLVLTSPLLLIGWALARLSSGGSGLFQQERVGRHGAPFTVYKLRTMRVDAAGTSTSTASSDPRLTGIGRLLRRTKLDELPQLWCVLRGDMSLVGPRPDMPAVVGSIPPEERKRILSVRPGITGLATLYFRDEETILAQVENPDAFSLEEILRVKTALNLRWIEQASLLDRFKLILLTVIPSDQRFTAMLSRLAPALDQHPDVSSIRQLRP